MPHGYVGQARVLRFGTTSAGSDDHRHCERQRSNPVFSAVKVWLPRRFKAFSGLTESAGFSLGWICDSTFVSIRHGGCDGQAIFSRLA